jgi:hypothetical protein
MVSLSTTSTTPEIGSGVHDALVLADSGSDMWLVRARFDEEPTIGTDFLFNGVAWRITWSCGEGFGALPVHCPPTTEPS